MKLGLCCGPERARAALQAGFDYVELPAHLLVEPDADLSAFRQAAPPVTNLFFPNVRLYDEARFDPVDYGRRLFPQAQSVGVRVMVVGSGRARKAPEGRDPAEFELRFADIVADLQELASPYGIRLAPESLRREETNVGTSCARLARLLGERDCDFTVDTFHVLREWDADAPGTWPSEEDWDEILPFAPAHIHLSGLDRRVPMPEDPALANFWSRIFTLGYEGLVSIEAEGTEDLAATAQAARQAIPKELR